MAQEFRWAADVSEIEWLRWLAGDLAIDGRSAPDMPSESTQSLFVGASGLETLSEAASFLDHVRRKTELPTQPRVLDFACGWGRLFRINLRSDWHVTGADSEPSMIALCKQTLPGDFVQIQNTPPYPFKAGEFDLVYVYSLFSHVPENVSVKILEEFARITKPGGYIAITVLEKSEAIKAWSTYGHYDPESFEASIASGETLYLPTGGGFDSMPNDSYGWAFYSTEALGRVIDGLPLRMLHRSVVPGVPQDVVILQRT